MERQTISRERIVNRELNPLLQSLPAKFDQIYDYQIDPISDIVAAFDDGYKMVALEAPTGSGKTLIAEVVRRMIKTRAAYVCHNKELQEQFGREFPYSKVLYGRANYVPIKPGILEVTCDDCTYSEDTSCAYCPAHESCPYQVAKETAVHSPVPVLNSAYWLNETQGIKSRFRNTGLAVLDEADTLEQVLMNQVEVYISQRSQDKYRISPPSKLTVQTSYKSWVTHTLDKIAKPLEKLLFAEDLNKLREFKRLSNLNSNLSVMAEDLERELPWVYTGGAGSKRRTGETISFRPVQVDRFGAGRIWAKDKRFLLMAALLPDVTIQSLGWTGDYARVTMESQFHPKNRQVVVRPTANLSKRAVNERELTRLGDSVANAIQANPGVRVLIHSVSYRLRDDMYPYVHGCRRPTFTYREASGRTRAIQGFKRVPDSILLAPGLERGLDLPDDACRVQLILKVPYLNLGDKQIAERLYNTPNGKVWYNQHVATTILQMVGRGVRHSSDYCVAYILDAAFIKWYKEWGHLLPEWFKRSIRIEYDL